MNCFRSTGRSLSSDGIECYYEAPNGTDFAILSHDMLEIIDWLAEDIQHTSVLSHFYVSAHPNMIVNLVRMLQHHLTVPLSFKHYMNMMYYKMGVTEVNREHTYEDYGYGLYPDSYAMSHRYETCTYTVSVGQTAVREPYNRRWKHMVEWTK